MGNTTSENLHYHKGSAVACTMEHGTRRKHGRRRGAFHGTKHRKRRHGGGVSKSPLGPNGTKGHARPSKTKTPSLLQTHLVSKANEAYPTENPEYIKEQELIENALKEEAKIKAKKKLVQPERHGRHGASTSKLQPMATFEEGEGEGEGGSRRRGSRRKGKTHRLKK